MNLRKLIAAEAVTLVKKKVIHFPSKKNQKVLFIAITNGKDFDTVGRSFLRAINRLGVNTQIAVIDERSGIEDIEKVRSLIDASDVVIAGLFGRVRSGAQNSVELPKSGNALFSEVLEGSKPVITVSFGNPYLLNAFPEIKTYIVSYGDMESLQRATAAAITGNAEFKGRLPITIGKYEAGLGLKIGKAN